MEPAIPAMNSEILTYISTPNAPPTCADPQDLWGLGHPRQRHVPRGRSNAPNGIAGTGQAASDVQAILSGFSTLNAELAQNSGVQAKS
jgi:hypothetical protein